MGARTSARAHEQPRSNFQRRRLSLDLGQIGVEARPFRRRLRPYDRRRRRQIGVVKRPRANEGDHRALFRFAENLGAALGAEAPMHGCAAVGLAKIVAERTRNGDILFPEERADRPGSASEILANPAPAIARA